MTSFATDPEPTLLDKLLDEQRQLTAVERFARAQGDPELSPAKARYYRALIPLEKPRPGEQYAFSVDLDACSGCKACVSACHSLNGLDPHETWRSTGLLHGGTAAEPYQQVVTTACHHCVDPACLNGCPVLAYEKDPLTGIVRHLDDQCIGCQYCVLKCPYDVPQYSAKRGIVRKCDLCHNRLAADEAPACVQACPSAAISIRIVSQAEIARITSEPEHRLLPGAFASSYTQPTTTYTSRRPLPADVRPATAQSTRSEPAHWPLIWMLLLTQAAAGLSAVAGVLALFSAIVLTHTQPLLSAGACLLLNLGLASSIFHLGRPQGAWRAFLGWRRSWMSREILAFSAFAATSGGWCLAATLKAPSSLLLTANAAAIGLGLVSVFCSAMIYVDTRRPFWTARKTLPNFFGTTLLLGSSAAAAILASASYFGDRPLTAAVQLAAWIALLIRTILFGLDVLDLWRTLTNAQHPNHQSALLIWERRRQPVWTQVALFAFSTVSGLMALGSSGGTAAVLAGASFVATFGSGIIDRYFFFTAVMAPRMPGVLAHEI